ncbi:HAD family phosphatase [Rhodobacter sp. SY28-1]|uniref:HAD family hydrolase n=1 Tax=Rhodobacter sp. SY28-1 TaxID=2562317 RepID=UPI0010C012A3|nr:HAD family phosphatase [Rhodobacter sp. SY28-1]
MTHPQAVLFDCDGVIVDSEKPSFLLFVEELAAHGLPLSLEEFETRFVGGTVEMVAARAREAGARLPEDWVARFYDRMYAMLAAGVPLVAGVTEVLDRLDAAGVPYAMGSNGSMQKMQITMGQHGLMDRFRVVLSGQAIGAPKPFPDVYLQAAAACGADPAGCVVIEDSASGARAGLAAGMRVLGYAEHGAETPSARALTALGVPLFHRMADLPGLLGV